MVSRSTMPTRSAGRGASSSCARTAIRRACCFVRVWAVTRPSLPCSAMLSAVFFRLSTWELWLIIAGIVLGFVAMGYLAGRFLREHAETLREPVGIVQGAFFALVGLILAFGLTLAIGRYDSRRAAVVDDANAIGTTYLRAQTLAQPTRSNPLQRLRQPVHPSLRPSTAVPATR